MNEEFEKWLQCGARQAPWRLRRVATMAAWDAWQASRKQALEEALEVASYSDDLADAISAIRALQQQ